MLNSVETAEQSWNCARQCDLCSDHNSRCARAVPAIYSSSGWQPFLTGARALSFSARLNLIWRQTVAKWRLISSSFSFLSGSPNWSPHTGQQLKEPVNRRRNGSKILLQNKGVACKHCKVFFFSVGHNGQKTKQSYKDFFFNSNFWYRYEYLREFDRNCFNTYLFRSGVQVGNCSLANTNGGVWSIMGMSLWELKKRGQFLIKVT